MSSLTFPSTTNGGIPYAVMPGYPKFNRVRDGGDTASMVVRIKAANIAAWMEEMLPSPMIVSGRVYTPPRWGIQSGALFVQSCRVEPFDGNKVLSTYMPEADIAGGTPYALVTMEFAPSKNEDDQEDSSQPETFLTHSMTSGGSFMRLKQQFSTFYWGTVGFGNEVEDPAVDIMKMVPTIEHNLQWPRVLNPPWTAMMDMLGKVNSSSQALFKNAAAETVMFMGWSASQVYLSTGIQPWQLDCKFSQRQFKWGTTTITWNHFWNPKTGSWQIPVTGAGVKVFGTGDLRAMFTATA